MQLPPPWSPRIEYRKRTVPLNIEPPPKRTPEVRRKDRYMYAALTCCFLGMLSTFYGISRNHWFILIGAAFIVPVLWLVKKGK